MEMCFLSKGINNFLNVKLGDIGDVLDSGNYYKIRMLEENNIPYVISPRYGEVDGEVTLSFCVDAGYVLERIMIKSKPDGYMLRYLMQQIIDCIDGLGEYLLVPEDLVIVPEYMMYQPEEGKLRMVCVPGYNVPIKEQLKTFLEYLMKIFNHNDRQGICELYDLYDAVCGENLDISILRKILSCEVGAITKASDNVSSELNLENDNRLVKGTESEQASRIIDDKEDIGIYFSGGIIALGIIFFLGFIFNKIIVYLIVGIGLLMLGVGTGILFLTRQNSFQEEQKNDLESSLSEYIVKENGSVDVSHYAMGNYGESEVNIVSIDTPYEKIHRLVPLTNGGLDIVYIDTYEENIVIGRGKRDTDYRLPTTQISRVHALIRRKADKVYIEDKGSTNGTFVNSNRLNPNQEYLISKGDIIAFANEEFFAS